MTHVRKLTPKQELFLHLYHDPASGTFGNATQSALKAGYSHHTAIRILAQPYMKKRMEEYKESDPMKAYEKKAEERRKRILDQAEENLEEYIKSKPEAKEDKTIKADMTKFATSTLGKAHYSTRNETINTSDALHEGETAQVLEVTFRKYLINGNTSTTQEDTQRQAHDAPVTGDYKIIEHDNGTTKDEESKESDDKE